jgi:hypothetical protein
MVGEKLESNLNGLIRWMEENQRFKDSVDAGESNMIRDVYNSIVWWIWFQNSSESDHNHEDTTRNYNHGSEQRIDYVNQIKSRHHNWKIRTIFLQHRHDDDDIPENDFTRKEPQTNGSENKFQGRLWKRAATLGGAERLVNICQKMDARVSITRCS